MTAIASNSEKDTPMGWKIATALMNFLAVIAIAICGWIASNQMLMFRAINSMETSVAVIEERLLPGDLDDRVIAVEIRQQDVLKRLDKLERSSSGTRPRRNIFGD